MKKLIIEGGYPLKGSVRLGGAKNASFKLMIASLLGKGETRLLNFSHISDVTTTAQIIKSLGGRVSSVGERTLMINPDLTQFKIEAKYGLGSRASTLFLGPLLIKFGQAIVPVPGGDKIGPRPLDRHFKALERMGAKIKVENDFIIARCDKLSGTKYRFEKNTHTGTETVLMAAVCAQGTTELTNAALEPEVDELILFLTKMGARITRLGGRKIIVRGVPSLKPVIHKIMPDRNEAVSYGLAAIITKGDVVVENAEARHLTAFLQKMREAGAGLEFGNYGIRFFWQGPCRAVDILTGCYPGFMTDWQPLWSVLATQSQGESKITEAVYLSRFGYVDNLVKMGAKISFFQPKVANPDKFFNFNLTQGWDKIFHGVRVKGPTKLNGLKCQISDLRAGATLVLAALVASGRTELEGVEHLDRGYENLDGRLLKLGAKIERIG